MLEDAPTGSEMARLIARRATTAEIIITKEIQAEFERIIKEKAGPSYWESLLNIGHDPDKGNGNSGRY